MSEELVQALRGQVGMAQTALTQAFVGHSRVETMLGQEDDIDTQTASTPLNDRYIIGTSPTYHAVHRVPWIGDMVVIGQKTLREKLGIDVMAQLKASVLKAQGR